MEENTIRIVQIDLIKISQCLQHSQALKDEITNHSLLLIMIAYNAYLLVEISITQLSKKQTNRNTLWYSSAATKPNQTWSNQLFSKGFPVLKEQQQQKKQS